VPESLLFTGKYRLSVTDGGFISCGWVERLPSGWAWIEISCHYCGRF
jgi:hypothetical protein